MEGWERWRWEWRFLGSFVGGLIGRGALGRSLGQRHREVVRGPVPFRAKPRVYYLVPHRTAVSRPPCPRPAAPSSSHLVPLPPRSLAPRPITPRPRRTPSHRCAHCPPSLALPRARAILLPSPVILPPMPPKKRQRIVLVCDNCHHRKIKCDRKLPCDSCTARGITSLCKYTAIERELQKQGKAPEVINGEVASLRNRIKELEALISVASLSDGMGLVVAFPGLSGVVSPMDGMYGLDVGGVGVAGGANGATPGAGARAGGTPTAAGTPVAAHGSISTANGSISTAHGSISTANGSISTTNGSISTANGTAAPTTTDFFLLTGPFGCIQILDAFAASYPFLLTWLLKRDTAFVVFWHYNRLATQNERFCRHFKEGVAPLLEAHGHDSTLLNAAARLWLGATAIPVVAAELEHELVAKSSPDEHTKRAINRYLAPHPVLFYPEYLLPTSSVYVQLSTILPPKFVILEYLNIWFSDLDPYFPILERSSFYNDMETLVQQTGESVTISVEKKSDLARLASLLFVLRFTYIYVTRSTTISPTSPSKYPQLVQHPIYCNLVSLAREMLKEFTLNTNHSFEVLQAFVLSKVVKTYSPDEGDSVRDTDVFITTLLHNACACGLNRDPDIFSHDNLSWINRTHRRKFWYFLVGQESLELMMFGRHLYNLQHSDVKLNEISTPGDNLTFSYISKLLPARHVIKLMMDLALDLHSPLVLAQFEAYVQQLHAIASGFVVAEEGPLRTADTVCLVTIKLFLVKSFFALYMIYERLHMVDQSFHYYKKFLLMLFVELEPVSQILQQQNNALFSVVLGSLSVRTLFIQVVVSILTMVHLNYTIKMYEGTDKPEHLMGMIGDVGAICRGLLRSCGLISREYFAGWRATKAMLYAYHETKGMATFEDVCHGQLAVWAFRTDQMHEICQLLEQVKATASYTANSTAVLDVEWLQLVPYDDMKLELENLKIQRAHALQVDAIWHHYAMSLQEPVPATYKGDEGVFTLEDIFLDGFYKF